LPTNRLRGLLALEGFDWAFMTRDEQSIGSNIWFQRVGVRQPWHWHHPVITECVTRYLARSSWLSSSSFATKR
jgi:hypothetical protein